MKQIFFLFALLNCFVGYSQKRSVAPVYTTATQVLSNKSIDADANTITNISNSAIKAAAGIAIDKLAAVTANRVIVSDASGFYSPSSVTTTTLGYLDPTSSIQSQLDNKVSNSLTSANVFVGNGSNVATGVAFSGDATITNTGDVQLASGAIVNADINASAAIGATKLIDGSISDAELGYINTLTANAQMQFDNKVTKGGDLGPLTIGTTDATDLLLMTGSNPRWRITAVGNLIKNVTSSSFGLHLGGTGFGAAIVVGDTLGLETPYQMIRERNNTDTDQWQFYAQKGVGIFTGTLDNTPELWVNQSGNTVIGGETEVAGNKLTVIGNEDVSGNLNVQGNLTAANIISFSGVLDFPSTAAGTSSELTIAVAGAAVGDAIAPGIPTSNVGSMYEFRATANFVNIKFNNYSAAAINPASATFKGKLFK